MAPQTARRHGGVGEAFRRRKGLSLFLVGREASSPAPRTQVIEGPHRLVAAGLDVLRIRYAIAREEGADANITAAGFQPTPLFRKSDLGLK